MLGSKKYFSSFRDQSGPVAAYLAWFLRKWLMRTSQENMALPWVWHVLHSIFIEIRVIAPPCNLCSNRSRERLPNFWDLLIRLWNLKFGTRIILLSKPSGCQHETHIYYAQLTKCTVMIARQQAGVNQWIGRVDERFYSRQWPVLINLHMHGVLRKIINVVTRWY